NSQLASQFQYQYLIIHHQHHQNKPPLTPIYSLIKQYIHQQFFFILSLHTPIITTKPLNDLYHFILSNLIQSPLHILPFKQPQISIPTIPFYTLSTFPFIEKA
ncbi:glycosyltransferase family protein, partial [Staphylococcus epidermidis]